MSEYIEHDQSGASVGLVEKRFYHLAAPPLEMTLESGRKLGPIALAYETYGELDRDRSNVILILHALSGDSHVAGVYTEDDPRPGWWGIMVGPGKGIDTNKYFVVCSNILGSCMGSTGPISPNPETGEPYGLDFPFVTIGDMVRAQKALMDHLGIERILSVIGGSIGGMQVLEWSVRYPERVVSAVPLATTGKHSALAIAFNEVARQAIMADPRWNNGNYYGGAKPDLGLAVARMIGHITYLSDESMRVKFGRRLQDKEAFSFNFDADFQVESYLRYQGKKFVERFDANSFLYITKAADYYDLETQHDSGSLVKALSKASAKFLVVSFTSDWLYPTYQSKALVRAMKKNGLDVSFCEIEANWGHDAFLLPNERLTALIRGSWNVFTGKAENRKIRFDLQIVASWIEPGSRVLDLGCGEGDLLQYLKENKQVTGVGIERVEAKAAQCVEKGLSVLQGDINEEILDYPDHSFDYVILSQTLQQVYEPSTLLRSLLRVGKKGIVSFPNFSHWRVQLQLLLSGYAPVTRQLPYEWYDTPNIRVITIKDFRKFSREVHFRILKEVAINTHSRDRHGRIVAALPNLRATYGIFLIGQ